MVESTIAARATYDCFNKLASDEERALFIPPAAFEFEPQYIDVVIEIETSRQRMIFHAKFALNEMESKALEDFRKYIADNQLALPAGYDDDERMIQRFLEGFGWKAKEAFEGIMGHHQFLNSFPMEISIQTKILEELNKGYIYLLKRDKAFRPIFCVNVKKLAKSGAKEDLLWSLAGFLIQFIITRALIPGHVENWISIIDMKGLGITQIPKKLMKSITKPLQTLFKGRLYRLHVCNAQWALKILFKIAKKIVDPLTIKKVVVVGENIGQEMLKLVEPHNLEKKFGGTMADKEDNFFPPDLLI